MRTMIALLVAASTVVAAFFATIRPLQAAGTKTVKVSMPYLESFDTTEAGEDEVYLILSGRWANGQTFSYRYPSASGALGSQRP